MENRSEIQIFDFEPGKGPLHVQMPGSANGALGEGGGGGTPLFGLYRYVRPLEYLALERIYAMLMIRIHAFSSPKL